MTEGEIKHLLKSSEPEDIERVLVLVKEQANFRSILELFQSIWKMTYENTRDPEFAQLQQGCLAQKIAFMNEQEGLIPDELVAVDEVTQLDLGGFPDAVLFPELAKYKRLQKLDLWENELRTLPDEFFELVHLKELYISCNLAEISPLIKKLTHLQILQLPGNELEQIPEDLCLLSNLEELDVSNNDLSILPDFLQKLPGLKKLNVSGNPNLVVSNPQREAYVEKGIQLIG